MSEQKNYGPACIGNVIRIIDDRTIIVNAGKDRLSVGDKIVIYEVGEPLLNLDGTVLANYEHQKDVLKVVQTELSYSVCQKESHTRSKLAFAISPLLETEVTEYTTMNVEDSDIQALKPHDAYIRVGDPIKLA